VLVKEIANKDRYYNGKATIVSYLSMQQVYSLGKWRKSGCTNYTELH